MPRRKRTSDEGGRRAKVSRVEHNEEPVVISDSDHDEEDQNKRSSRTERWKRRDNKSHIQDMTEEEMLALAMSLSTQEANTAAHRQQLEDKDIQKAIEESLNESTVKASAGPEDEAGSSSDQPQENVGNPTSNLRRKLSYLSQDQTQSENERETTSPLPEMPDLSQTASSHLSSRSSFQISGPPAITEDKTSSDKQTVISDTPEDEFFKSQSSLVFTSHSSLILQPVVCVEKLSQDFISASTDLNVHTQDSTVTPTCADRSRFSELEDSPFSKCITQNNFHRGIDSLEDRDDHKNANGNEDETQIPDEDTHLPTKLSQELSTDPDTCLSLSRKSQLSSPKCVPEDKDDDVTVTSKTTDVKQAEDQTTQGENAKSNTENAPKTQSWNEFTSHMVVHLADDDDDDDEDDGSQEVLSPSPVLIKEKIFRPVKTELSPTHSCISSSTITLNPSTQDTQLSRFVLEQDSRASKGTESKPSDRKHPHTPEDKGERTISYYWGVPFCPVGQTPDEYTRVIMCQMEVYEKTLKEAQRELLRKADWGQPVFPGSSERSFGVRRWKRHRAPRLSEDEEENEEAEEKENNPIEVEEEREETKEESVVESQENAVGEQSETYVVLSSPETKDEQLEKNPFFSQEEPVAPAAAAKKPCRKNIPWDTSDDTQVQCSTEQVEEKAQNQEGFEDNEMVCPETQLSEKSTPELMMTSPASPAQPQSRADSEVMEVEEGGDAPAAQEEMMEQEDEAEEASVECPMCSKLFPLSKIEMHAAYCDGEADHREEQSQVVARRKRTRRNVTEETSQSGKSTLTEKCFICQGLFSLQEYKEHVDLCCKKKNPRTNQKNKLLSALDWTEQRHAGSDEPGPSDVSTQSNCGRGDPVATESVNCSATSSCPSSTFSPQSESTACLSDSSKNSQRLSRKRKFKR